MRRQRSLLLAISMLTAVPTAAFGQEVETSSSPAIQSDSLAYDLVRDLTTKFGPRPAGSAAEAHEAIQQLTRGVGADHAIITVDVVNEDVVGAAFDTIRKGGDVVVTGLADPTKVTVQVSGAMMTLFQKTLKGTLFGSSNPMYDIPKLLGMYQAGQLKLDELVTKTYTLDQLNEGYDDLLAGKNIRGVLLHDAA